MSMPFVVSQAVWSAKEASETIELKSEFEKCQVTIIEIATIGFSGTLDVQGKLHEIGSFANVPYIRQDQASIQTPSVSQISLTLNTSTYRYVVLGYWRRFQLVMARTAGSITCGVVGSSAALAFPYLVTKLIANSGVDIGDVDVLSIATGTNVIGKVRLVTATGDEITDDTADAIKTKDTDGAYTTPTHTAPVIGTTTTVGLAANANRLMATFVNDSGTPIYMKIGADAVLNQGIRLNPNGGSYTMSKKLGNLNTGAVNAIGATGTQTLLVTEGV